MPDSVPVMADSIPRNR